MRYDLDALQDSIDILELLNKLNITYLRGSGLPNGDGVKVLNPFRDDKHFGSCSIKKYRGRWYFNDFADKDNNMSIFNFIRKVKEQEGENLSFTQAIEYSVGGRAEAVQFATYDDSDYVDYSQDVGKPAPLSTEELKLIGLNPQRWKKDTWTGAVVGACLNKPDFDELDKNVQVTMVAYADRNALYDSDEMYAEYILTKPVKGISLSILYNKEFDVYKSLVKEKAIEALIALNDVKYEASKSNACDSVIEYEKAAIKEKKIYAILNRVVWRKHDNSASENAYKNTQNSKRGNCELKTFVRQIAF